MATALLLGGGAPTLTLQSGALAALDDHAASFDAISTAGAGMVIGLLYAAPKGKSRQQALADTREMGVHDLIYDHFPVNYKVFFKPGTMADAYRRQLQMLPQMVPNSDASRLFADWMALVFATWSPSDLSLSSQGLCEHAPWIDDVVDFDKLQAFPGEFYMNAYNVTDRTMDIFTKQEITPDHFRAALAFPLIYPPFKLNGKTYIEGSAIDTLCFEGLLKYRETRRRREERGERKRKLATLEPLEDVVVFDVLSSKRIIREPKDLYDAWIQSIMIPLVEIAKDDKELFKYKYLQKWRDDGLDLKLHEIKFDIPDHHWPKVLDWSYGNLSTLYDIGYEAGMKFYEANKSLFQPKPASQPPARATAGQT